jgi:hypothetical protein
VDRDTHCLLSWDVVLTSSTEAMQACLERAPQAKQYYSDAFPLYDSSHRSMDFTSFQPFNQLRCLAKRLARTIGYVGGTCKALQMPHVFESNE